MTDREIIAQAKQTDIGKFNDTETAQLFINLWLRLEAANDFIEEYCGGRKDA